MVLKGFSRKEWRRALAEPEQEKEEIIQPLSNLKINQEIEINDEECLWHIFTEEIFPHLPANQLHTLKSVCKNWLRIISSPYFVGIHLKIYNNQSRIRVLTLKNKNYGDGRRADIIDYNINNSEEETKRITIPYPPKFRPMESSVIILGSCDGLICFYWTGVRQKIAMFNPSTRKCFWLKSTLKENYVVAWSWFGHHPSSGEYVLVLGELYRELGVYKFNSRSQLQKIHSTSYPRVGYPYSEERFGTLLHGALHWPVTWNRHDHRYVICAYHLDDNKYFEISPPTQQPYFKIGVAAGCLFVFFQAAAGVFEMWIMKEYKVQQSWTKYAKIEAQDFGYNSLSPLGFFADANLILHPNGLELGLVNFTFNHNKTLLLMNRTEAILCADSLVSPRIIGT